MSRVIESFSQYFDDSGDPLANGFLEFLISGTNNTQKQTFIDGGMQTPNDNPLQLDGAGRVGNVFGLGSYRVRLLRLNSVTGQPGEMVQEFDPVNAQRAVEGAAGNFAEWDSETIYHVGYYVTVDTRIYRSLIDDNVDNNPPDNLDKWEQLEFIRYWNANITYALDDLTQDGGALYFSLQNGNINNEPASSPTWWNDLGAGTVFLYWAEVGTSLSPNTEGHNLGSISPDAQRIGDIYQTGKHYLGGSEQANIEYNSGLIITSTGLIQLDAIDYLLFDVDSSRIFELNNLNVIASRNLKVNPPYTLTVADEIVIEHDGADGSIDCGAGTLTINGSSGLTFSTGSLAAFSVDGSQITTFNSLPYGPGSSTIPADDEELANKLYVDQRAAAVTISPSAPSMPVEGKLWWDNTEDQGKLYIYYTDVDSSQWVEAVSIPSNLLADWGEENSDFVPLNADQNLGSTTKLIGNIYHADDKFVYFGDGQEARIYYSSSDFFWIVPTTTDITPLRIGGSGSQWSQIRYYSVNQHLWYSNLFLAMQISTSTISLNLNSSRPNDILSRYGDGNEASLEWNSANSTFDIVADAGTFEFSTTWFESNLSQGFSCRRTSSTSTLPVFTFVADKDTGIGWAGSNTVALIGGGNLGMSVDGGGAHVPDDNSIYFGDADEFSIIHGAGGNTNLVNDVGYLRLQNLSGGLLYLTNKHATGVIKLQTGATPTTAINIDENQNMEFSGWMKLPLDGSLTDNFISVGVDEDLQFYHNGTNSYITNNTGILYINNTAASRIQFKCNTIDAGFINSSAQMEWKTSFKNNYDGADTGPYMSFGVGDDLKIYHDGTDSYIRNETGALAIETGGLGTVWEFDTNGHFLPADGTQNIGANANRVNILYMDEVGYVRWIAADNTTINQEIYHSTPNLFVANRDASGAIFFRTDNINRLVINVSGHTYPNIDSAYTLGLTTRCWSNIYADAGITACSDRKWKENVQSSSLGLDFINALDAIEWKFKGSKGQSHKRKFHGLLAQDVLMALEDAGYEYNDFSGIVIDKNIDPETGEDLGGENMGLRYEQFIGPLIKAVQELTAKVKTLEGN